MSALDDLRAELEAEVLSLNERGLCGCGCGTLLKVSGNGRRRYDEGHRDRAYRKRVAILAKAQGVVPRATLRTLQSAYSTGERRADAQRGRAAPQKRNPRPGVSAYFRSLEAAEHVRGVLAGEVPFELDDARTLQVVAEMQAAVNRRHRRPA